jgi:hypothetical protein
MECVEQEQDEAQQVVRTLVENMKDSTGGGFDQFPMIGK